MLAFPFVAFAFVSDVSLSEAAFCSWTSAIIRSSILSTVRSITVGWGSWTIYTELDDVDFGDVDVVETLIVDAVNTCCLDLLVRLKSFSPTTSGSVARLSLWCCAVVVVVSVLTLDVLDVDVAVVAVVTLAVDLLVACAAHLDQISVDIGHPYDQTMSGAVVISLTALGWSILCGMTIVYWESDGRFCPGLFFASISLSYGL
jgi:hypothetical protein